jgi:O-Antigen ligase
MRASAPSVTQSTIDRPSPISGQVLVVAFVLLLMPFPVIVRDLSRNSFDSYDYVTILFPVDLAMIALLVVVARSAAADLKARRVEIGWAGWTVVAGLMTVALAAHPSGRGLHNVIELYGTAAIAYTLARADRADERSAIVGTIGAVAVLETLWAVAQRVRGAPLGLFKLGESHDPFYRDFGSPAPQGSMVHIYVLAGLALVAGSLLAWTALEARRPVPWAIAAAVAIMPIGFTYSRAGALSLVLLVGAVALAGHGSSRHRAVAVAAALAAGAVLPALIWSGGWTARAHQTTAARSSEALTTERGHLISQATALIRHDPLTGVGPGLYIIALRARSVPASDRTTLFKPVHNVPLLLAAEGGVFTGLVVIGLLLALGWRAVRTGALAVAIYLAYLPFFLLDHFAYSFPQGMVLTGLWLGGLDAISRSRSTWLHHVGANR